MNKLTIKIKYFGNFEPIEKISIGDWIDLRAAETTIIDDGDFKLIPLGVAMQLPEGYEALVVPRSSTFKKYGITMTNSVGVIDESYCGDSDQWHFPALGHRYAIIPAGERICQFRIFKHQPEIEFEEVFTLDNPDRGGFGSTGTV